jgi:hypothetical protein
MFQTQDMAGQRINGNSMETLLLTQQKPSFSYPPGTGVLEWSTGMEYWTSVCMFLTCEFDELQAAHYVSG